MGVYGVDCGHTIIGQIGSGASRILHESTETRNVGKPLMEILRHMNHKVINCTVDKATTQMGQLNARLAKFNAEHLDFAVSIHFNAFDNPNVQGVEIYTKNGEKYPEAQRVLNNIAALGFTNRGIKNGNGVARVVNRNKHKIMLIEVCFLSSRKDVDTYQRVGAAEVARAIAAGLTGQAAPAYPINGSTPSVPDPPKPPEPPSIYETAYQRVRSFILDRGGHAPQKRFMDKMTRAEAFSLLNRMTDKKYDDDLCALFPELCVPANPYEPPISDPLPNPPVITSPTTIRQDIVDLTKSYLGVPYQWGGSVILHKGGNASTGRKNYGVDCAHFTHSVLYQIKRPDGVRLSDKHRVSIDQFGWCKQISKPEIGDLVFYGRRVHHVGVFIGDGKTISASGGGSSTNSLAEANRRNAKVKIHNTYYMANVRFGRPPTYNF